MDAIGRLTETLFADTPKGLLYHYTTLSGMLGIVGSCSLWASDIRYMNDSAELKHAGDLLRLEVQERISRGQGRADLLGQFADWVAHRITNGHLLFAASFRSHGNLLSQWRGYSTHGKGVSLGFAAESILACATRQRFQIGRCIYAPATQRRLIRQVVDAVETQAGRDLVGTENRQQLAEIYQEIFAAIEVDLLRIAAVIKHPSFREEREWRIVSPVYADASACQVNFREAHAMLVPYVSFDLQPESGGAPRIDHVYLGPTSNRNISMNSLKMFLAQNGITPERGIDYCQIPYRQK
ncbi:MAG: DUF2971 domain-containing protein [Desulforhopalus sp.]|jgi:hypothetical protein|nr:DUF2971 domain-containing protein [Desulforhopalus sp.]